MSVRVMGWIWENSQSKGTDRLVLLAIADCASDDGSNAYPSMAKLVQKTGLTDRGVQKAMARLSAIGELTVHRNAGPKGCNRYRVVMATPEQCSPPNVVHPEPGSPPEPRSPAPPNVVHPTPEPRSPGTVLEPSINHQKSKALSSAKPRRDDVEQVCRHLIEKRIEYGLRRLTINDGWRESARLMIDKDGRTVAQIIGAIDWALNDDFWRTNIESLPTLRRQYEKLLGAAQRQRKQSLPQQRGFVEVNGQRYKPTTADNLALIEELQAEEAHTTQHAIEGAA